MNPAPKNETEAIRSDIDVTRRRMDDTMDALGDRLQPRHLLDEVLGFFRNTTNDGDNRLTHMREKITDSCDHAMHAVVDSVKKNPMPAVLIGAGVVWMIYSSRRESSRRYDFDDYSARDAALRYDPDTHYDRPLEYPATPGTGAGWEGQGQSTLGEIKDTLADKAASAKENVKEKLSEAGEAAREKVGALRERAGEMTTRLRDNTREAYARTRERVIETTDHHPLEIGLVALAAGLIAGLALPTPNAVNRTVGPAADRLRARTREAGSELVRKGKRVAEAAVGAVKQEAQAQGLTPESLRNKATAVADRALEEGKATAQREGLTADEGSSPSSPPPGDPSLARP